MTEQTALELSIAPGLLFDRMPMGIAIIDRAYRILRYNPTWEDFSARYAPAEGAALRPGVNYFDFLPGAEATVLPLYQRVLAGETIRQEGVPLALSSGVSYWDVTLAPLIENGEVVALLNVSVDATERVLARQTLEQRVEERTREVERRREVAESLRDIISMINAHLPLEAFLDRAVQAAARQLGAGACVLHHFDLDNQMVVHQASYGLADIFEKGGRRPFSALKPSGGEHYLRATLQRQPTYGNYPPLPERLEEIRRDPTIPEHIKAERIALRQRFASSFSVPLFIQDKAYGGLVFYYAEPQDFAGEQIQLGLTFAEQMAIAIENARLLAETQRRREVAESLRDTLSRVNAGGSLDEVLDFIVAQADQLSASKFVALYALTDARDMLEVRALRGRFPEIMRQVRLRPGEGTVGRAVAERHIMIIPDVEKIGYAASAEQVDERRPVYVTQDNLGLLQQVAAAFKAVLAIPLLTPNGVYGALAFYYPTPHQFEPEEVQLASTFADQAVLAIENARLFEEKERRRVVAESLADILSLLNSPRSSQDVLDFVVQRSCELLQADACLLYSIHDTAVVHEANYNLPQDLAAIKIGELYRSQYNQVLLDRQPAAIPDAVTHLQGLLAQGDLSPYQRRWYQGLLASFRSYLGIPLIVDDQVFGGLVFYFHIRRSFNHEDLQLAQTLAAHAALAIENARLRHQAAEMAIMAERSRLARDLHDAVTQTLFSASLIADVLPKLWERNPETGQQKLEELRLLTRGALSEMRTLLLELRPDTLAEVELGDLYRHLANAFSGRTRVPVTFTQEGQAALPPPVKEAFYRVAQEALNNIAKHADAGQVQLHLALLPEQAEVVVRDDGAGFDPATLSPENLGLKIMRERAAAIGAQLSIHSEPGKGTQVTIVWEEGRGA